MKKTSKEGMEQKAIDSLKNMLDKVFNDLIIKEIFSLDDNTFNELKNKYKVLLI